MRALPLYAAGADALPVETVAPLGRDAKCTRCVLSQRAHSVCIAPEVFGPPDGPLLLVVGEAPGKHEDDAGRPFIGQSGALLRPILQRHWSGPVAVDNGLRCYPSTTEIKPALLEACRPYLGKVVQEDKPARIVAVGAVAIEAVMGRSFPPFSTRKGYGYTAGGTPVYLLVHPAAALRNRFVRGWLEEDLRWALTTPPPPRPPTDAVVAVVETPEDAAAAYANLRRAEWVTIDVETFGRMHNPDFRVLSMSATPRGRDAAYAWSEAALADPGVYAPLRALLEDPRVPKNGTNLKFDQRAIQLGLGTTVRGVAFDVRLVRKLLQADAKADLDTMQPLVGMGGGKDAADRWVKEAKAGLNKLASPKASLRVRRRVMDTNEAIAHLPDDRLQAAVDAIAMGADPGAYAYAAMPEDDRLSYNARDTVSTDRLGVRLADQLRYHDELLALWREVVLPAHHAIAQIEANGIAVSKPAIYQLRTLMAAREAELMVRLRATGLEKPGSPAAVSKLLYETLGLSIRSTTETGRPSTDRDALDDLDHPVAKDILEWRRVSRFKAQYADGMMDFIRADGRIHPDILMDGTETGRPSARNPNLLNIPRAETPEGKMCRDIFVAPPGYRLLEADYNQIELRVAALLSGDPVMIEVFRSGVDFHLQTAKMIAPMFNIDPDLVFKDHPLRSQAKIVNFGTLYGKNAAGLAYDLGITKPKAQNLIDAILGKFKRLAAWIQERLAFARKHGYCRTWWKGKDARIRPLWRIADAQEEERETAERSSWNTPIQGTATEFTNASLGQMQRWLDQEGVDAKIVLTVYDAIVLQVAEPHVEEVGWHLRRIMEGHESGDVPTLADLKVGQSWGSMVKLAA